MIGFVGAGNMGLPMIKHLLTKGFSVGVWARRPEQREYLESLGVKWFASPSELAQKSRFFCTNVMSNQDVEEVLLGPKGAIHGLSSQSICIDFSTISPQMAKHIARTLSDKDVFFLDAPVSGGVSAATNASLTIMVGGDPNAYEQAKIVFDALGTNIFYIGPSGSGQVAKACNQTVQVITIQGIAEAMLYAKTHQADLHAVLNAISTGFAGSRMLDLMGPKMADRDFKAGIEARLHAKDYSLITSDAAALGLYLPALEVVHQQLTRLMDNDLGLEDTSSLLRVLEGQQS